jgi:hypothetical protein
VLDLNIKGFFQSIDWELMLKAVRQHTDSPVVLLYVERWLNATAQMEGGSIVARTAGKDQLAAVCPKSNQVFRLGSQESSGTLLLTAPSVAAILRRPKSPI